jgi:quercetin dioxygenase-like cupin family protein
MLTVQTGELDLLEAWLDSDRARTRVRVTFPINKWAGSQDSALVYFELEPGCRLSRHTDSAEEILYVIGGEAEAEVGDERGRLAAGDLAVIPARVPHGLANVGDETLKVIGFFSEAEVVSSFDEPIQPVGASVLNQGAPPPARP